MPPAYALYYTGIFALVGILGYDVWAATNATEADTISAVIQWLWQLVPVVALWWGIFAASLRYPQWLPLDWYSSLGVLTASMLVGGFCWTLGA